MRPPRRRRRAGGGFPYNAPFAIAALLFVAVMVIPVIVAFTAVDFGGSSGSPGIGSRDGPSLLPAERFEKAWAKVRAKAGPEDTLDVLRVAPERIDAIVASPGGQRYSIQVWGNLSVTSFPAGTVSGARGMSLRRLDTALPARVVARAAERLKVSRDSFDYLALSALGGTGSISVFFEGGRYATADIDGRNMRVPGQ